MTVRKNIAAPASAVWAVLADFGNLNWLPIDGRVDFDADGPLPRRFIHYGATTPVVETLLWAKPDVMEFAYSVVNSPLAVKRYEAVASVAGDASADAGCTVTWAVEYEPCGDDSELRTTVETIYEMQSGLLAQAANRKSASAQ